MKSQTILRPLLVVTAGLAVALTGCQSKEKRPTMENLETQRAQQEINQYADQAAASGNTQATKASAEQVNIAFAALDKEIAELEAIASDSSDSRQAEAARKLEALRNRRAELRSEFNQSKFDALVTDVKDALGSLKP